MTALVILGQVTLSVLAIFGLIFLFRAVFDWFFAPVSITVAVTVKTKQDADNLDILLCEAEKCVFRRHGIAPMVLVSPELMQGEIGDTEGIFPPYRDVIEAYHAKVYVIEQDQPSSE